MNNGRQDPVQRFLRTVERATNETQKREAFVILAATAFGDTDVATDMALGAEYQVRFRQTGAVRRGAVDSFFGNLVVEFENRLAATREHALDQLRGYVAGAWGEDGSTRRPYLAVAADGANWEVFVPSLVAADAAIDADNIALQLVDKWPTDDQSAASLRDFLNRLLFRSSLVRPTAENFARDFGLTSPAFARASGDLLAKLREVSNSPQLGVLRGGWSQALQLAYGDVDTDDVLFVKHTYLAVLARILVWAALERRAPSRQDIDEVVSGRYFVGRRIANLVEDDFFKWHSMTSDTDANRTWIALGTQLATYDLPAVGEDVLKPLYEQLVDPEFRHELGEYYTPDWLATAITKHLLENWTWGEGIPSVLDPACGSGTFLRAAIVEILERDGGAPGPELLDEILGAVAGIDVHPLAVITSRATYLLAIRDLVLHARRPVSIPVFLANSLMVPAARRTQTTMFEYEPVDMQVAGETFTVPVDFVRDGPAFDAAIDDLVSVSVAYGAAGNVDEAGTSFIARIGTRLDGFPAADVLKESLAALARLMARLVRSGEDSVYGFLLKNQFRPAMIRQSFDYVVGNPPWLTVGDISTDAYKALVVRLATGFAIAPRAAGEQRHTELGTLFLAQAATQFLRLADGPEGLRVGMILPRSVFSASHHRLLRQGRYRATFDVAEIWDLDQVEPLFNVPSCVLFLTYEVPAPTALKPGYVIAGRLPRKDVPADQASRLLTWVEGNFELVSLGNRTAWRLHRRETAARTTATRGRVAPQVYVSRFRQGAIIYPQNLFVVDVDGPAERGRGPIHVRTNLEAAARAKLLRDVRVDRVVDSDNLFCTAAAEHVLPYSAAPDWLVVLPTTTDPDTGTPFIPASPSELRQAGRVDTASWLEWAEGHWEPLRRDNDEQPLWDRLNTLSHFSAQGDRADYVVLYTASGARTYAAVLQQSRLALPFIARDKTYWGSFANPGEAHYLAAFLNSDYAAGRIQDWMTRGLMGPRDVHKRVLDVPWPAFNPADGSHARLATVSGTLAQRAADLRPNLPQTTTGRRRIWLRQNLDSEQLQGVEALVEEISTAFARRGRR